MAVNTYKFLAYVIGGPPVTLIVRHELTDGVHQLTGHAPSEFWDGQWAPYDQPCVLRTPFGEFRGFTEAFPEEFRGVYYVNKLTPTWLEPPSLHTKS